MDWRKSDRLLGEKFQQWKPSYDQFNINYKDVKAGDYYDLIFDPNSGLQLKLNDRILSTITDQTIALAYLNVWFGKEPFSKDLKNTLLKIDD